MRKYCYAIPALMLMLSPMFASAFSDGYEEHLSRAMSLYKAERYREAVVEFENAGRLAGNDRRSVQTIDYYTAISLSKTGDATKQLEGFLLRYPNSMYGDDVEFALAGECFDAGRFDEAVGYYLSCDPSRLNIAANDEYRFKCGYALFTVGNYAKAKEMLTHVDGKSRYASHAKYCLAYMDYADGIYASAKSGFAALADDAAYASVVPFYMLHIEFMQGNDNYVVENAERVLSVAEGARRIGVTRMVAESWFRLEDWHKVADFMNQYESMEGDMGREECYLRGYAEYRTEEYDVAETYLSKACGADDRLTQNAAYHLADCYLRSGQKERAMQSFAMASTRGFDDTVSEDALYNYCKLQYELGGGYFNESINQLNRYLTLYPNSSHTSQVKEYLVAAYYNSHNFEAAYDMISNMRNPDNNLKIALQKIIYFRALECYDKGEYPQAVELFNEAARYNYNAKYSALTTYWLGEALYKTGDFKTAASKFETYIRLSPKTETENLMARYNTAYSYYNLADTAASRRWFEDFVSNYSKPDGYRADAFNRLGDVYAVERAFWRAIEKYDGAIATGTDAKYYATFRRAVMLGLVDRGERKIETLNQIINEGKGGYVADAMYELGRTYIVGEQYDRGAQTLKRFVELYPASQNYMAALSDLGLACQNMGNEAEAMKYYKMVVEKSSRTPAAVNAMANIREMYVDDDNVNDYFDYASKVGFETDDSARERDSLSYAAAFKLYVGGDRERAGSALKRYADDYKNGAYLAPALYYAADCAVGSGRNDEAIGLLSRLSGIGVNDYSERSAQRLSQLCMEGKLYRQAAQAYKQYASLASSPVAVSQALDGYVDASMLAGDNDAVIEAADYVIAHSGCSAANEVKAKFAMAKAMSAKGDKDTAMQLYRDLSKNTASAEGSESAYRVIEATYEAGDREAAEQLVYAFAEQKSLHQYWLGKSFLVLGDIYASMGDSFQARATYQSVIDGYSILDDGIIEEAKARIGKLK